MIINKEKLHQIAIDENEEEKRFRTDFEENKDLYKASTRIALRIKKALKLYGMTEKDLAEKIGVDTSIICNSLTGKANLDLKTIVKFEKILGINIIDRIIYKLP